MCIYCGTNKYRRIYENHFGPIPKDEDGRSYEIHHIDGNHSNNDPINLKCVTIQEHYDIHYSQGDWNACFIMAARIDLSPNKKSDLSSRAAKKRVENRTHHVLYRTSADFTPEWRARISAAKKGQPTWNKGIKRTEEEKTKMRQGHSNRERIECIHCGKTIDKPNYTRYHGDKCSKSSFPLQ